MRTFGNHHPAVLMVYFLSVLLITMFVSNPILQLTAFLGEILFFLPFIIEVKEMFKWKHYISKI